MANRRQRRFLLFAALFSAIVGSILAGGYIAILYARKGSPSSWQDVATVFFVGVLFAAIPAGLFGLLAGIAGGTFLLRLRSSFKSRTAVAGAGTIIGAVLGATYPVVSLLLHWTSIGGARTALETCALGAAVGALCGCLFGCSFASMLLDDIENI